MDPLLNKLKNTLAGSSTTTNQEGSYTQDPSMSVGDTPYPQSANYSQERTGYGGHGGRAGVVRPEARYDSSSREAYATPTHSNDHDYLFTHAIELLRGQEHQVAEEPLDEAAYVRSHQTVYGGQPMGAQGLGMAATVEALKLWGGGDDKDAFVASAMREAVVLLEKGGGEGMGLARQEVVTQAAMAALKLFLKGKMKEGGGAGALGSMLR